MFIRVNACAVAVVALFAAGSVQAADLIIDGPAVQAATAGVDWSGAYIGGHIGAATGTVDWDIEEFGGDSYDISGGVIGAQMGYNWQQGNLVYGLEGDISFSSISGDDGVLIHRDVNWTASLRGRLGFAVESLLLYGTAGVAVANSTGEVFIFDDTQTHVGWTVGLGIEAMVAENVSAQVEYNYTDYGIRSYDYAPGPETTETGFATHAIKAGVNFHF